MNLIIIVADSVRPDYMGIYGCSKANTPTLDSLAKNGVYFNNVITSAPWTLPSVSSFISGIYSHRLGMFNWSQPLPKNIKTLFHYFAENNFKIGSFVFDEKDLFSNMPFAKTQGHSRDLKKIHPWLEQNSKKDFLLYIHSWWTHIPYEIKKTSDAWRKANKNLLAKLRRGTKEDQEHCQQLYLKSIENVSENLVAAIVETLEKKDILEDTMIIFSSDHGETWGERLIDKSEITNNFSLHGRYVYDESIKIPLIFYHPKSIPSKRGIDTQIRTIDFLSTIIDLFKFKPDVKKNVYQPIQGKSFYDLMFDTKKANTEDRLAICSTTDTISEKILKQELVKIAIRLPPRKLIWTLATNEIELYNISKDPNETNKLETGFDKIIEIFMEILKKELKFMPVNNLPNNLRKKLILKTPLKFVKNKGIKEKR